ncbi:L,D-transpeptidase [Phreatobacter stygius]|uniref:L,D-transpeptidase n=1 Tax=Phreatobacter stygius TaxID=1940610 RepID=UPI001FE37305|nr:L,D-transpeptidase [Phreatobacter stygius]
MRFSGFTRAITSGVVAVAGLIFAMTRADAAIVVRVDKTTQTMRVIVDGEQRHVWNVSTGRIGYNTPVGTYSPQRLERHWRSRKYGMAPMPHSIFFRGGYAIHGTNMVGRLGRTDSHGCIRLAPGNARTLFEMVAARRGSTRIVIEGTSRPEPAVMASRRSGPRVASAGRARTAQMRLAQPVRNQATRPAGQYRVATPGAPLHLIQAPGQGRAVAAAMQPLGQYRAVAPGAPPRLIQTPGQHRATQVAVQPAGQYRVAAPGAPLRLVQTPGQHRVTQVAGHPRAAHPVAYRTAQPRPMVVMPAPSANPFANWFMLR